MWDTPMYQVVAYSDSLGFTLRFISCRFISCKEDATFCETVVEPSVKPSESEYATKSDYFLA